MATVVQHVPSYRLTVVSRIAASLLGGWLFVWGFVTFGIALGLSLGMSYAQVRTLIFLLAFLVFLTVFLWAFAARSITRVWTVLVGGGVIMTTAAWLMTRTPH